MGDNILQKLRNWRSNIAKTTGVELFRVLPNKVLEDIARLKPTCKDDLMAVKGIREKKFSLYGNDILTIIQECIGIKQEDSEDQEIDKIYTVSDYLDILNSKLSQLGAVVRGEVSSISFRNGHAYFAVKDKGDESVLNCFMWSRNYEMCGIDIVQGMEIVIHGTPEIYKPYGKLSFRTDIIELVGEGALKKAYDELKRKLDREGLFDEERKKIIPDYPHKIGLITSRDGAVINDFMSNIGNFGYDIIFMDSRVEGAAAIGDLISAIDYFSDKDIDILVIIRGGGSLESLQAFNNEMLVRKLANLKFPVICGIGHDKDKPLVNMVADLECSTPSIVATTINKSWERARDRLDRYENSIFNTYEGILRDTKYDLETTSSRIKEFYRGIFGKFEECEQALKNLFYRISYNLDQKKKILNKAPKTLAYYLNKMISETSKNIDNYEKMLIQNNPERQLKLGYSIVTLNDRVIKSHTEVEKGDLLKIKVKDGKIHSKVEETFNNLI